MATLVQILLCLLFYGGFVVLCISYWWDSRRNKRRGYPTVNEQGELPDEPRPEVAPAGGVGP